MKKFEDLTIEEKKDLADKLIYSPEQIKRAIEDFEYFNNGFDKLNGVSVECERICNIDDDYENNEDIIIYADVNIYFDADGKTESYANASYPLRLLKRWIIE